MHIRHIRHIKHIMHVIQESIHLGILASDCVSEMYYFYSDYFLDMMKLEYKLFHFGKW